MSIQARRAAAAYKATQIGSRSPLELVVMLYDGLVRALTEGRDAMARGDLITKAHALSRSMRVIGELQNNLNLDEGGKVAQQLDALYTYTSTRLLEVNLHGKIDGVDEALKLMTPLCDAWAQITNSASASKVSA